MVIVWYPLWLIQICIKLNPYFVLSLRHLVLIGCQTFQAFFDRHPQFLSNFDKFNAIEIDGVLVSSALKMHTSRVLAVVEDIVENTGNPEKIRNLLLEMGRHHYKQVFTKLYFRQSLLNFKVLILILREQEIDK